MKVAIFSGGKNDPASRFRYRQHFNEIMENGIEIKDFPAYKSQYAIKDKMKRPIWLYNEIKHRNQQVKEVNKDFDLCVIQRPFIARLNTLESKINIPVIFDFDDAIYINQKFNGIDKIIKNADSVICGNKILEKYTKRYNEEVRVIPTAVDVKRFFPKNHKENKDIIMGWSGTATNFPNLYKLENMFLKLIKNNSNLKLLITSNEQPMFKKIPKNKIEFVPWSAVNEVELIQKMDIGLMPLDNTEWNRGKCSYKMLLYMSCGIPVVVSPVGMNNDLLNISNLGFGADSEEDWYKAISCLINDEKKRNEFGKNGRKIAVEYFSKEVISKEITDIFIKTHKSKQTLDVMKKGD